MRAIKLDVTIAPSGDLRHDTAQIVRAEQLGFDGVWTLESAHNPFFPLTLAAKETDAILLGAGDALAFPRSPMVAAQIAWDLARQSRGRFVLGLSAGAPGTGERQSIEDPIGQMREYIESLRAIWDTFQTGARLRYRGKHYQFRLMAPFFNPGPIAHPDIPIYLAGDKPEIGRLAGECGQGLHFHALHTPAYLSEVLMPAVEAGLKLARRRRSYIEVVAQALVVSGASDLERQRAENDVRERLAFLASAAENRQVMDWHGLGRLADDLAGLAREEKWAAMTAAMTDELLRQFALVAEPHEAFTELRARYAGIADRVCLPWNVDCAAIAKSRRRSA